MKFDIFATMKGADDYDRHRPVDFDICVERLPEPAVELARDAISRGIPYYHSSYSQTWVPYAELAIDAGLGIPLDDPTCPYFVPPRARAKPVFLPELITGSVAAGCPTYRAALDRSRVKAQFLTNLRLEFPPRPYDLRVQWFPDDQRPLTRMIHIGLLDAFPGDRCWWVVGTDAQKLLPPVDYSGDGLGNEFCNPQAWTDHDALDRFDAEHRRHWPEIYGYQHPEWLARGYQQPGWSPHGAWS
ncbi:hypothetical protein ABVV53_08745 [Novosphingobium sp. RD2P27]|uniref:Uncharacterized protein n=1 Tax=Novosphingobium kalidii TaxID=3230299 RepID=A0ABV2D2J9_9SPHN